jgi:hypothetical protein
VSHPAKAETDAAYPLHIHAVATCATDLEIIHHRALAIIGGGEPFNKMFTQ